MHFWVWCHNCVDTWQTFFLNFQQYYTYYPLCHCKGTACIMNQQSVLVSDFQAFATALSMIHWMHKFKLALNALHPAVSLRSSRCVEGLRARTKLFDSYHMGIGESAGGEKHKENRRQTTFEEGKSERGGGSFKKKSQAKRAADEAEEPLRIEKQTKEMDAMTISEEKLRDWREEERNKDKEGRRQRWEGKTVKGRLVPGLHIKAGSEQQLQAGPPSTCCCPRAKSNTLFQQTHGLMASVERPFPGHDCLCRRSELRLH